MRACESRSCTREELSSAEVSLTRSWVRLSAASWQALSNVAGDIEQKLPNRYSTNSSSEELEEVACISSEDEGTKSSTHTRINNTMRCD